MNPRLKKLIDKKIAAFEAALKKNNGQPLSKYELAIVRSYIRFELELAPVEDGEPSSK